MVKLWTGHHEPEPARIRRMVSSGDLPNMQPLNSRLWGNGFLPGKHQGVRLRSGTEPVLYLNDPSGKTLKEKRSISMPSMP